MEHCQKDLVSGLSANPSQPLQWIRMVSTVVKAAEPTVVQRTLVDILYKGAGQGRLSGRRRCRSSEQRG